MKKKIIFFMILYIISFNYLCVSQTTIKFVTDDSPPYTIKDKTNDKLEGFLIDVVKKVFTENGFIVEIEFMSYKRSIIEVLNGNANAVLLISEKSAPSLVFLETPIVIDSVVFFARNENKWEYNGISSLEGIRIASGLGYDFSDADLNEYIKKEFEKKSPYIDLITGENINSTNFKKLLLNRVDVVIATEIIGKYVLKNDGLKEQIKIAGKAKNQIVAQTGFDPNNPKSENYSKLLSKTIKEMQNNGELNKILSKYGL